jgi:hypothetical protein
MFTWLCAPDKYPELGKEAIKFLTRKSWGAITKIEDNSEFDDKGNNGTPFFYLITDILYPSIMHPICTFIFERIDRYHKGELKLEEAVPIPTCQRPGCGRFVVPQRPGRMEYCGSRCRSQDHQLGNISSGEQRDYMWLYRLEREPIAICRRKLRSTKVTERLDRIEKDWPDLAEKAQIIRGRPKR